MLRGMAIPGDRRRGISKVSIQTIIGHRFVPASDLSPPPFVGKTRKRRKTRETFYKGYEVVYLPENMKGLTY